MKRNELKKALKPLIKECIKEVIFEEGVLAGLISEVVKVTNVSKAIATPEEGKGENQFMGLGKRPPHQVEKAPCKINEVRQKVRKAIGEEAYNGVDLFEGTLPLGGDGDSPSPLGTYAASDAGVDITSLYSPNWKSLV